MGFFSRESDTAGGRGGVRNDAEALEVPPGTRLAGPIRAACPIRVAGSVRGNLTSEAFVEVTDDGVVHGNVEVASGVVAGCVEGDIIASGKLELRATARVEGDIASSDLVVEEGARFDGTCSVGSSDSTLELERLPKIRGDGRDREEERLPVLGGEGQG